MDELGPRGFNSGHAASQQSILDILREPSEAMISNIQGNKLWRWDYEGEKQELRALCGVIATALEAEISTGEKT